MSASQLRERGTRKENRSRSDPQAKRQREKKRLARERAFLFQKFDTQPVVPQSVHTANTGNAGRGGNNNTTLYSVNSSFRADESINGGLQRQDLRTGNRNNNTNNSNTGSCYGEGAFDWVKEPTASIVLCLLEQKGISHHRYSALVNYHMSEVFLFYLQLLAEGSYFIHYLPRAGADAASRSKVTPKERFFQIKMLPFDLVSEKDKKVPHLVHKLHQSGVQLIDAVPLCYLVGVTTTANTPVFSQYMNTSGVGVDDGTVNYAGNHSNSNSVIQGCRDGRGHRTLLPTSGCFSLWFYDRSRDTSREIHLLTLDARVFEIWTQACRGIVSVNSSTTVQAPL